MTVENIAKPVLGVIMGDAAGVGPELIAKIIADGFLQKECRPILIGDKRVLDLGMKTAGVDFPVNIIGDPSEADFAKGVQIIDTKDLDPAAIAIGEISVASGKAAGDALVRAVDYFKEGKIDGIVFAPLNKTALKKAGFDYESEQYLFAERFGTTGAFGEINVLGDLMTSRVTSHIPIKDVSANLNKAGILESIAFINDAVARSGVAKPRVAVAGLNPHNGENGTCGREEVDIIRPAVEEARMKGIDAQGPFSADVLFIRAFNGDFDAVVTMFHDQGQIALKLKGFDYGVTLAGGHPAPIATPAHGTAYDIAGKNKAKTDAIKNAVRLAAKMARNSRKVAA